MERTLLLVSIFALSLSTYSAERLKLKFKDGTTLNGAEIYVPTIGNSTGNPNGYGVILKYSNKLYIHHFPYRQPRKVTRYTDGGVDDGKYKTVQITEELEHYQPRSSPPGAFTKGTGLFMHSLSDCILSFQQVNPKHSPESYSERQSHFPREQKIRAQVHTRRLLLKPQSKILQYTTHFSGLASGSRPGCRPLQG